jgi:Na+-translocating ferredoxin:NAD+ oxidoreductase RnfD subunit
MNARATMPRAAIPVERRIAWTILALLPGAIAFGWASREWGTPCLVAFAFFAVRHAKRSHAGLLGGWKLLLDLLLTGFWMRFAFAPASSYAPFLLIAAYLPFVGREDDNPFQPAMLACALALAVFPTSTAALPPVAHSLWIAGAYALGGCALVAGRCMRWQAPAGMLAGVASITAPAMLAGRLPIHDAAWVALLPTLALTAFFVVDDPPRTCMSPRGRIACGFLTGAISMAAILLLHVAHRDDRMLLALTGAVLLMNAAAPWLDREFKRPRKMRSIGASCA